MQIIDNINHIVKNDLSWPRAPFDLEFVVTKSHFRHT